MIERRLNGCGQLVRRHRLSVTGLPQHVVQRGHNRAATFFAPADYRAYLDFVYDGAQKYGCLVHAYVLMTNHVHLLATPCAPQALSRVMQHLGRCYVRYVNDTYERSGTLWEGRFRATVVDSERYFLTCCRYIELNPVRAGIVATPANYLWSSYRCNALGLPDRLISSHEEYTALGITPASRRNAYLGLFRDAIDEVDLQQIRLMTDEGWPLGSDVFKDELERRLGYVVRPPKRGRPPKSLHAGMIASGRSKCDSDPI
jgi:putative transposase